ncbi:MAG TPA: RDD family protein [Gammaproteobacteria bacterium]|nr:RDD family protein [Gammaproteobacteria bacterium]
MSTSNPYAPPRGTVRDMPAEGQELAGRGVRLLAYILDGIIVGLMVYVPALIVAAATGGLEQLDRPESEIDFAALGVPIFVGCMGFIAWAWITLLLVARYGQTMAKRMLDIKVVRSDGSQASLGRIFWLRNVVNQLLSAIPLYFLVDLLFIFGERRQCIHDLIADTIVVKA